MLEGLCSNIPMLILIYGKRHKSNLTGAENASGIRLEATRGGSYRGDYVSLYDHIV